MTQQTLMMTERVKNLIPTGLLARIKDGVRALCARRKEAKEEARHRELNNRFEIREKAGRLFLTCDGIAFQEIDPSQTAANACELLRAARIGAQVYKSINR